MLSLAETLAFFFVTRIGIPLVAWLPLSRALALGRGRGRFFFSVLRGRQVLKKRPMIIGTHHPDGVFLANGPGIPPGVKLADVNMVDVAPAMLYALGLEIPEDLDGTIPRDLFAANHLKNRPPRTGPPTTPPPHWGASQSPATATEQPKENEADDAEVMARLKALGYIE